MTNKSIEEVHREKYFSLLCTQCIRLVTCIEKAHAKAIEINLIVNNKIEQLAESREDTDYY